jgi:hypothetical protein
MDKLEDTPYCPICSGCGEEGCCTPLNCSQDINGSYCLLNLKHLKFGYKMYDEISKLIGDDPKYKEQIEIIFNKVYDKIYCNDKI